MTVSKLRNRDNTKSVTLGIMLAGVLVIVGIGAFVMYHFVLRFGTGDAVPYPESGVLDYTNDTTYFYPDLLELTLTEPVVFHREELSMFAADYDGKLSGWDVLDNKATECTIIFNKPLTEPRLKHISEKLLEFKFVQEANIKYITTDEEDMYK